MKCSNALPPDASAVVISQHIPAAFSKPFAERMNRCSAMSVCRGRRWSIHSAGPRVYRALAISTCWWSATVRVIAAD